MCRDGARIESEQRNEQRSRQGVFLTPNSRSRWLGRFACIALAALFAPGCAATATPADAPPQAADAPAPELAAPAPPRTGTFVYDQKTEEIPIPGTSLSHGKSTLVVHAPIDRVRASVIDFNHYTQFMPHYTQCRIVSHAPDGALRVQLALEVLGGLAKMHADIAVLKPVTTPDGEEMYGTKFIRGNIRDFVAIWRLKPIDDATTQLSLEVFVDPGGGMPSGFVNSENRGGAAEGVAAMRDRIEKGAGKH